MNHDTDRDFIVAIDCCVRTKSIPLAMHLVGLYLNDETFSNVRIAHYLKARIATFLQDGAVNFDEQTILHLLAGSKNQRDIERNAIKDLITLIVDHYEPFAKVAVIDALGQTPFAIAEHEGNSEFTSLLEVNGSKKGTVISMDVDPVSKVNGTNDDINFFLQAIYHLVIAEQFDGAMSVLQVYLNCDIENKVKALETFIANNPEIWSNLLDVCAYDDKGRNLLHVFAGANYDSTEEAKAGLVIVSNYLRTLTEARKKILLSEKDDFDVTPIGCGVNRESKFNCPFIALFLQHGAVVNQKEGSYRQTPVDSAKMQMDDELKELQLTALKGNGNNIGVLIKSIEDTRTEGSRAVS